MGKIQSFVFIDIYLHFYIQNVCSIHLRYIYSGNCQIISTFVLHQDVANLARQPNGLNINKIGPKFSIYSYLYLKFHCLKLKLIEFGLWHRPQYDNALQDRLAEIVFSIE